MTFDLVGSLLRNFGSNPTGLTAPGLAVADNGDNTGATATITGATGTVTVYTASVASALSLGTWTASGTRSGNGTLTLSLAAGHYLAYASYPGSLISRVVYVTVTTGAASVEKLILDAVQARLVLLDLAGIAAANIVTLLQEPADIRDIVSKSDPQPGIAVFAPKHDPSTAGTNAEDDVPYNVVVGLVDMVRKNPTSAQRAADAAKRSLWLQRIGRAFRTQDLTGAPTVYTCTAQPFDTPAKSVWSSDSLWTAGYRLKFVSREPRGL